MHEATFAQDFADSKLMCGVQVTMHEAHGGGGDAFRDHIKCQSTHGCFIERYQNFTIDADALRHLASKFVESRAWFVTQGEEIRTTLIADVEKIAETLGYEQRDAAAFAL